MLPLFGIQGLELEVTVSEIAQTVGIYLGIPFVLAVLSRYSIKSSWVINGSTKCSYPLFLLLL